MPVTFYSFIHRHDTCTNRPHMHGPGSTVTQSTDTIDLCNGDRARGHFGHDKESFTHVRGLGWQIVAVHRQQRLVDHMVGRLLVVSEQLLQWDLPVETVCTAATRTAHETAAPETH